jgi:hypothetical protein
LWLNTISAKTAVQGGAHIEEDSFHIIIGFAELAKPEVRHRFIAQGGDDEVTIYCLPAAGTVLKHSFRLFQVDEGFVILMLLDALDSLLV